MGEWRKAQAYRSKHHAPGAGSSKMVAPPSKLQVLEELEAILKEEGMIGLPGLAVDGGQAGDSSSSSRQLPGTQGTHLAAEGEGELHGSASSSGGSGGQGAPGGAEAAAAAPAAPWLPPKARLQQALANALSYRKKGALEGQEAAAPAMSAEEIARRRSQVRVDIQVGKVDAFAVPRAARGLENEAMPCP